MMALTQSQRKAAGNWISRILLYGGACFMLLPLAWMVCTALKDDETFITRRSSWVISIPKRKLDSALRLDRVLLQDEELEEFVLAPVESPEENWAPGERVRLSWVENSPDPEVPLETPVGERCLEVRYNLESGDAASWSFEAPEALDLRSALGMRFFVRGDSGGHLLDLALRTREGVWRLDRPFRLSFTGWRELNAFFRAEDAVGDARAFVLDVPGGDAPQGWDVEIPVSVTGLRFELLKRGSLSVFLTGFFENFMRVAALIPFGRYYLNTLVVVAIIVVCQLVTSSLAAFAFARLEFPGRDAIFFLYLATMMIPQAVTMIPQFLLIHYLGWYDTLQAVVIPGLATVYGTFLLRQFFRTIPRDLEDAARIDGCTSMGILTRIILPLSKPALIALSVSSFISAWSLFQWPLIVTESQRYWTLQIGLAYMTSVVGGHLANMFNVIMAGALIVLIPQVVIFLLAQKAFQRGIVLTGLKG